MANIKLSAFATDIKGKVGGTVFSKNGGGAYVKNKSNGQRGALTASSNAKARFGNVSSAWKNLSAVQQKLWQDATPLYPTTDKFGDTRLLSGRSLFLQLNTNLVNAGKNMISVPAPPRDLQIPDFVNIVTPDLFQLKCVQGFRNYINEAVFVPIGLGLSPNCPALDTDYNFTVSVQIKIDKQRFFQASIGSSLSIFDFAHASGVLMNLFLVKMSSSTFKLNLIINSVGDTGSILQNGLFDIDSKFHCVALEFQKNTFDASKIYFDGLAVVTSVEQAFSGAYPLGTLIFGLGSLGGSQALACTFCDFRVFDLILNSDEHLNVAKGYILDQEFLAIDFAQISGNDFSSYSGFLGASVFSLDSVYVLSEFIAKFDSYQSPSVMLNIPEGVIEDQILKITCSKSQSFGNTARSQKQLAITNSLWFGETSLDLSGSIKNKLGLILANSALEFQIWSVDLLTGQQTKLAVQTTPRKQRFKAGSELTEKVN